jgi:hypothetical protein
MTIMNHIATNTSCESQQGIARRALGLEVIELENGGHRTRCIVSQRVEDSAGGNAEPGGFIGRREKMKHKQGDEQKAERCILPDFQVNRTFVSCPMSFPGVNMTAMYNLWQQGPSTP